MQKLLHKGGQNTSNATSYYSCWPLKLARSSAGPSNFEYKLSKFSKRVGASSNLALGLRLANWTRCHPIKRQRAAGTSCTFHVVGWRPGVLACRMIAEGMKMWEIQPVK